MTKSIWLIVALFSIITIPLALAQNNPGHDSLYILRDGDNISGTFNFTGEVLVPTPLAAGSAATKGYVDAQLGALPNISGTGLSGQISFWVGGSELSGTSNLFWSTIHNRLGINTADPQYDLDVNGTGRFVGALFVATPTAGGHAATKAYVDSQISNTVFDKGDIIEGTGIALAGDLSERLVGSGNVTVAVDTTWANNQFLQRSGGTMDGEIDMDSNRITGLPTPTAGSDAATRDYVLSQVSSGGTDWTIAADTGSSSVGNTDTVTIQGGTGITTSESARTVTINVDDDYLPYTGATQNVDMNQRNITNFHVIQGHDEDYGMANNGTMTIIGYIGDLT